MDPFGPRINLASRMTTPLTRQQLQGMRQLYLMEKLTELVNEETRETVLERARAGCTEFLWDLDEARLSRKLEQQGWATTRFTMEQLQDAVEALYPDCTVTLLREWIYVPQREKEPKQVLRASFKIDWS